MCALWELCQSGSYAAGDHCMHCASVTTHFQATALVLSCYSLSGLVGTTHETLRMLRFHLRYSDCTERV